jgi:PleD family two-component response regulator
MERVRHHVAAASVGGLPAGAVTVSAGLVQFMPGEAITLTLERADRCLYSAKAAGRNQVHLVDEDNRVAPVQEAAAQAH